MRPIDADEFVEQYNLKDATKYGNKDDEQQNHSYSTLYLYELACMIDDAPTIDIYGKWIPCRERLPKSEDKYGWVKCNVTVMRSHWPTYSYDPCDSPYDEYIVTDAMYDVCQKIWHLGDNCQLNALIDIEDSPLNGDYVVAWMPLPEPYKGE